MPHEYDEVYYGRASPRATRARAPPRRARRWLEQLADLCARFVKHFSERTPSSDLGMGGGQTRA